MTESVAGLASVESELVEAGSSSADGKTTVDPYSTDPAHWGEIDESVRAYWAERGPESCQNMNVGFQASERVYKHQKRHFSKSHFKRKMLNGEYIERPWLLYSPSTGAAFCFACRIFRNANTQSNFETGFSDWKHATERKCLNFKKSFRGQHFGLTWVRIFSENYSMPDLFFPEDIVYIHVLSDWQRSTFLTFISSTIYQEL